MIAAERDALYWLRRMLAAPPLNFRLPVSPLVLVVRSVPSEVLAVLKRQGDVKDELRIGESAPPMATVLVTVSAP